MPALLLDSSVSILNLGHLYFTGRKDDYVIFFLKSVLRFAYELKILAQGKKFSREFLPAY